MTFILDGDEVLFRATAACQKTIDWGDGVSKTSDYNAVVRIIDDVIQTCVRNLGPLELVAFSSESNFRKELWSGYKAHRDPAAKPVNYWVAKEYLATEYPSRELLGLEADDIMGIFCTPEVAMASSDKDMSTIPHVRRYSIYHNKVLPAPTEHEADRFLFKQALTGDPTDGFKGCPNVGDKRADKILADCETLRDLEDALIGAFESRGLTEDDALLQLRLARILRPGEYENGKPRIYCWTE